MLRQNKQHKSAPHPYGASMQPGLVIYFCMFANRINSGETEIFYHPSSLLHRTGRHPENAGRIRAILRALAEAGWTEDQLLSPDAAPVDLLAQVHDIRYIDTIRQVAERGGGYWDLDTIISSDSYEAATRGAGAAMSAVDSAMKGTRGAFAIMRPPGHHALAMSAMGFCLFNNVAVAAQHAIANHGLERVMIVDWDIHHGNGTQDTFYDRSDVLFFSAHRYPFYPGTGALHEIGKGKGRGHTVNVPLPAGVGDAGYDSIFEEIVKPVALRYKPQLILISAGYDAHKDDPLGDAAVSTSGFTNMAITIRKLADEIAECEGRLAGILEGGYNAEALAESVVATIFALSAIAYASDNDPKQDRAANIRREPDIGNIIRQVRQLHGL